MFITNNVNPYKYPYRGVLFISSVSLFTLGLFLIITSYIADFTSVINSNCKFQVYLNNNLSDKELITVENAIIRSNPSKIVLKQNFLEYVSKHVAAIDFFNDIGADFVKILDNNPLRNSFIVYVNPELLEDIDLCVLKKKIQSLDGVFEVDCINDIVESVIKNIKILSLGLFFFIIVLFFITVIIIFHAIKISFFSQRMLIKTMELVGASDWFIKRDFIKRSCLVGWLSANIASYLIIISLYFLYNNFNFILISNFYVLLLILFIIHIVAILVSYISTDISISRYILESKI